MKLSELLACIPSDEFLTELWPASEYTTRQKGPYITRSGLIMLALYYQGFLHLDIARVLNVHRSLVYNRLPNTFKKLKKVHVENDMERKYCYYARRGEAQEVLKQFEDMKQTMSPAEILRKEWRTALDEKEKVEKERNMLLRYVMHQSDIDVDLCMREEAAGHCPYHAHCKEIRHCQVCILTNLKECGICDGEFRTL